MADTARTTQNPILYSKQSKFQTIDLIADEGGILLELNGSPQVHTNEERLYHESVATLPAMLATKLKKVLILGGGDGLAARDLLKFPEITEITLVEIDEEVIRLGREVPEWKKVTEGSLLDPRVNVVCDDAIAWLARCTEEYDLIIHDVEISFTDQPGELSVQDNLNFIENIYKRLAPHGLWVITVSDDVEDQELVDDVYETAKAELPWYYRLIAKIFPPKNMIDKVKLCLSTRSDYVRYWPCPFPLLGSHITFYASDEKLDTIHRWPSVRPQYIDEKILEKIS